MKAGVSSCWPILANRARIPAVFRAGANGYLFMGPTLEPFIKALELVMLGETVLPKAILPLILEREDEVVPVKAPENFAPQLSRRERLILRLLAEGHANKVIASEIGIAEATVKVHVKSILFKIGVINRTQAAMWAMNNGLFIGARQPLRRINPVDQEVFRCCAPVFAIGSSMAPPLVPRWHRPTRYFIAHTVAEVLMIERQPLRLRDLFYVARGLLLVGRVDQRLVADARLLFSKARATALNDIPGRSSGSVSPLLAPEPHHSLSS